MALTLRTSEIHDLLDFKVGKLVDLINKEINETINFGFLKADSDIELFHITIAGIIIHKVLMHKYSLNKDLDLNEEFEAYKTAIINVLTSINVANHENQELFDELKAKLIEL